MRFVDCDLIIVGSGFGGSVCALRAAEAGRRVVVLERGPVMNDAAYEELADGRRPLVHRPGGAGLVEIHPRRGLAAVGGNAVGGGSHVYTAVTMPCPREVFDRGWPAGFSAESMMPYYDRVCDVIRPSVISRACGRLEAMRSVAMAVGGRMTPLPLAMEWGDGAAHGGRPESWRGRIVEWLRGGPAQRKRTLDRTYLAAARSAGADVRGLHEAIGLVPLDGGYRVLLRRWHEDHWVEDELRTARVILAMGTLHTVRMLLCCRHETRTLPKLSAELGRRFYTNGDGGGLVVGGRGIPPIDDGPPVTSWIDFWDSDRLFVMETGLVDAFVPGWNVLRGKAWSFGVMGFDDSPGTLRLDRRGRLLHEFDPAERDEFHRRTAARLKSVAEAIGGWLLAAPALAIRHRAITVHPLGGAGMADSAARGVVDSRGEVFGYPGLFVADGSVLPTPTGVAPSMTIAAVAERIAEGLAE